MRGHILYAKLYILVTESHLESPIENAVIFFIVTGGCEKGCFQKWVYLRPLQTPVVPQNFTVEMEERIGAVQ